MSDFKGYWKNYEDENYVLGSEEYCAQQAWKHQQAKIDDLGKQLDMMKYINDEQSKNIQNAFKTIEIEQGFKDELQKRVDAVKAIMNEYYTGSFDESAEMAGLISLALRGAND